MEKEEIQKLIEEYREENHVSPYRKDSEFTEYILDGVVDINSVCGTKINYEEDKKARRLLKLYVLYADYKKLAEFRELYIGWYDELQRKYFVKNKNTNIQ